ncbi:AvrD family protein [Streptococcus gallolyticus]|uniref:Avirulence D protein (AvrD) n=1 Tax=Streptococcus gallolyticus TaxID=315405 RepID=A0A1H9MHS3_9STRE|nr:AvrD family protein [Streptococcus gallolyticus]SER23242.1 avirulence D protein (AvrD) [Streptococcus gallolyticus]
MSNVDALLGDHRQRYFGDGHKRTLYGVTKVDDNLLGSINHSGTWSSKSQQEVQPHLSTLDGVILASLLAEKYLESTGEDSSSYFLTKFEIKSGMKPIENLNEIPLILKSSVTENDYALFNVLILDMKVSVTFRKNDSPKEVAGRGQIFESFISNHLKNIQHDIYDISFLDTLDTADKCSIFCKANRENIQSVDYKGISANFSNCYSLLELLIVFSQMAEMLAYHADNIDRDCSQTLWMKNVTAELVHPIPVDEIELLGKIRKNKLIDMKGHNWKIFEMSGADTKNRICISSKIAHQLPDLGE